MKKFISLALALIMVFSLATVALAVDATTSDGVTASEAKTIAFTKKYETTDGNTPATYPAETLQFNVTVPSGSSNPDSTMISVADQTVGSNPDNITITIPSYSKVGKYNYTVTEVPGNTQGVTYSEVSFGVQVLATYNAAHTAIETQVVFTTQDGNSVDQDGNPVKIDSITNVYTLGALDVSKEVTGNLGSKTKEFNVDVTFSASKDIKSTITYVDGTETKNIIASDWKDGEVTVTITLKDGETVSFTNIPDGVTYTVKEQNYTTGDKNSDNGYDAPKYNGEENANGATGTISATKSEVEITNNKGTTVDTGITLDTLPFVLILAVCAGAVVLFVIKRRRSVDF